MVKRKHRSVDGYSREELEQLRERFLEWAEKRMEVRGILTKEEAMDAGWGPALLNRLITSLKQDELLRDVGRQGYRLTHVDVDTVPLDLTPARYLEAERTYLRRQVWEVARSETSRRGRFSVRNVVEQVGCSETVALFFIDDLEARGRVESLGNNGRVACGVQWDATVPDARKYGAGHISESRRSKVYKWFLDWADVTTREKNHFTRKRAVEAGLSGQVVDEFLERGLARGDLRQLASVSGTVSLYRSDRVDSAEIAHENRRSSSGTPYSVEELERLRDDVREWIGSQVSFSGLDIRKRFDVTGRTVDRVLEPLLEDGTIVHLGWVSGYVRSGAISSSASLQALVEAAKVAEDPECSSRSRGRRAKGVAPDVDVLTSSQVKMIGTVARDVAEGLYGDRAATERVSLAHPLFDRNEDGAWRLVSAVRRWSENKGRSPNTISRYVSTGALMMEFALDRDLIDLDRRTHQVSVPAAEWKEVLERWKPRVVEANDGRNAHGLKTGVGMLARTASQRGDLSPEETNWRAVRDRLRTRGQAGKLPTTWKLARRAYGILRELGEIEGPEWSYGQTRKALFPKSATEAAAVEDDWSQITNREGERLTGLIDGPYGLKAYRMWATLDEWELEERGLPPRSYVDPTPAQQIEENRHGPDLFRVDPSATLDRRLYKLGYYLGWIERSHTELDLTDVTLADLLRPRWMKEMAMEMRDLEEASRWDQKVPFTVHQIASALAVIGTPFLEAQMRQHGDDDRADEVREAARLLRKFRHEVETIRYKDIEKITSAYRGSNAVSGWIKLNWLCDLILDDAEEETGLSIDEQVLGLMDANGHSGNGPERSSRSPRSQVVSPADCGEPKEVDLAWRSYSWAVRIRSAMLINFVRLVPVRRKALTGLEVDMWKSYPGTGNPGDWPQGPWAGEIQIEFPGRLTKNSDPFNVSYIPARGVGVDRFERGARRELLYLWFAPGGARELLLTTRDGDLVESPYVFPATARKVEGRDPSLLEETQCKWRPRKLSGHYGNLIEEYGSDLQIDVDRVQDLWGALGVHAVRALFGTYWAGEQGHLQLATDMLQHADVNTTKERYCGNGPRTILREVPEQEFG